MKRYQNYDEHEKNKAKKWKREQDTGGFTCSHCKRFVVINAYIGTANRNHCNWCLWSKHVDNAKGDRKSHCHGGMQPIGLTFKHEGLSRIGEIMLIHDCSLCGKISINRIARDDPEHSILDIFEQSQTIGPEIAAKLKRGSIDVLDEEDRSEVLKQLFGNV